MMQNQLMLRSITVENFYSIRDEQTLDLSVAKNATDPGGRFGQPNPNSIERFAKVAAIFGANASGKTTVLRAIAFAAEFVKNSATWLSGATIPFFQHYSSDWETDPTRLSFEFDAATGPDGNERCKYHYSLELAAGYKKVSKESLFYYPGGFKRRLFERIDDKVVAGPDFDLPKRDPVRSKIRPNASVISVLAQFNHEFSTFLHSGLSSVMTNLSVFGDKWLSDEKNVTKYYAENPECLQMLKSEISRVDLGISGIELESTKDGLDPVFIHEGIPGGVGYILESEGTKRFYRMFPYLYYVLKTGSLAVLDELDNDIHPLLISEILQYFYSPNTNPHNAQLVMSSHSPSLLEFLEKEEVYFTEKSDSGETEIYGLKDIQGVRRSENIYGKYLSGAYGGIPRVG